MDFDEPCRRYSLQENGRYVMQPVSSDAEYESNEEAGNFPELPQNVRVIHRPQSNPQRKYSLDEYSMMPPGTMGQMPPQLQSMYAMPYTVQMRPVQEVQPLCLEKSPKGVSQSLHKKTVKRRHLLKAQKSQSQGYYPQTYPSAMFVHRQDSPVPGQNPPSSQQIQLSPPLQMQSLPNMYTYPQDLQPQQKVSPQQYGSQSGPLPMSPLSPVQMVHPLQQYQPVSTTSPVQLVPIQALPAGSRLAYQGSSGEDDSVFYTYTPYQVPYPGDDSSGDENVDPNLPRGNIQPKYSSKPSSGNGKSYVGVRRMPSSSRELHSAIRTNSDNALQRASTETRKTRSARKVSFEDEVHSDGGRERSYSSPPVAASNDTLDGYEDDDAYLKMRQRYAARKGKQNSAQEVSNSLKPPDVEASPECPEDSYEGIKRLPRVRSALKSSREKKISEHAEDAVDEAKAARDRRASVPAKMKIASEQNVESQESGKSRRNSVCPMTAYNLR